MPESTTLAPNASTTMKVIAKFQNETNVTGPYSGETKTIEVKINAEQDDGNGGMNITPVSTGFTGTIYRWGWTELTNKESSANSYDPSSINIKNLTKDTDYITKNDYPTYSSRTTKFGYDYYLKHDIVDDEIINSYVCFVYNNAEHCMKGGDGGTSFAANTQIIKDFQTFNNLPDNSNPGCYYNSSSSYCFGSGFITVLSYSDGYVKVNGSSSEGCIVANDGNSYCIV